MTDDDLLAHAQAVIDANLYLPLGPDGTLAAWWRLVELSRPRPGASRW